MKQADLLNKQKAFQKWLEKNGACNLDFKNRNIVLYDGGLFSIESKNVKRRKIIGYKKLPNGFSEIIFSKKATIKDIDHEAILWFEELRETINYLKRLERFLNKQGYKTTYEKKRNKNIQHSS